MTDIAFLQDLFLRAKDAYYNKGKFLRLSTVERRELGSQLPRVFALLEGSYMGDKAFDKLEYYLKKLDPKNAALKQTGAPVAEGKFKVPLPVRMPSLLKVHGNDGSVAKWSSGRGPFVVSDKLDGVSLAIEYRNKVPYKAYNRGDGTIGQDISFLIPYLDIPKRVKRDMVVRGEGIMSNADFKKFWSEKYKNARNLTSGVFNKKGKHEALHHVAFIAYEIQKPRSESLSKQLATLKNEGFRVVTHKLVSRISDSVLSSLYKARVAASPYLLDGLVVYEDVVANVPSSGDPVYAVAYKESDDSNLAEAVVVKVHWKPSKHGYLKPRVEIEPVQLAGVTVTFTNGFNAYFIEHGYSFKDRAKHGSKKYPVGPGSVIELIRSGEVIPDIQRVVKAARKPQMPDKALGDMHWTDSGVDLVLDEGHGNDTVAIKKIAMFLSAGLGVEHMAVGVVSKLYQSGFTTIEQILSADPEDFQTVPGIRETSANKFYQQIKSCKLSANMADVAANSGFFGTTFGSRRIQAIMDVHDLLKLPYRKPAAVAAMVSEIKGFSHITAERFAAGLKDFVPWVKTLPLRFKTVKAVKPTGSKFADQAVCFTGVRDAACEAFITAQGGKIAVGVTGNTTMLVTADAAKPSVKSAKAESLGLPVLTLSAFKRKYKIQ